MQLRQDPQVATSTQEQVAFNRERCSSPPSCLPHLWVQFFCPEILLSWKKIFWPFVWDTTVSLIAKSELLLQPLQGHLQTQRIPPMRLQIAGAGHAQGKAAACHACLGLSRKSQREIWESCPHPCPKWLNFSSPSKPNK